MPIIRVNKELYEKLKTDKGDRSFGNYINFMVYSEEKEDKIKKVVREEIEKLRY